MRSIHSRLLLVASMVMTSHALLHAARAQPYQPSDFTVVAGVTPASYSGTCPVTLKFNVLVTSKASTSATLKRDTFDNSLNPLYLLQLAPPGAASMSTSRNQSKTASGWEEFSLVSPVKGVTSGKVLFNVVCTNPPPPAPGNPTTSFTPPQGKESPKYPKPGTGNLAPLNPKQQPGPGPPTVPERQRLQR